MTCWWHNHHHNNNKSTTTKHSRSKNLPLPCHASMIATSLCSFFASPSTKSKVPRLSPYKQLSNPLQIRQTFLWDNAPNAKSESALDVYIADFKHGNLLPLVRWDPVFHVFYCHHWFLLLIFWSVNEVFCFDQGSKTCPINKCPNNTYLTKPSWYWSGLIIMTTCNPQLKIWWFLSTLKFLLH